MDKYQVTLTLTEPQLGTVALNDQVYSDYIASKTNGDTGDEAESVLNAMSMAETIEKGTTGFHRNEAGVPIFYNYVVKGFCKDACGMMRRVPDSYSAKLKNYKGVIDGMIFVQPRQIPIEVAGPITILERPLRAETAQGPRVALARSEVVPAGSIVRFTLSVLGVVTETLLREWFEYGQLRGLGQWRNGGYGTFTAEIERQ